ncbi:MAG: hypothetical protein V2A78_08165 [bacterium]
MDDIKKIGESARRSSRELKSELPPPPPVEKKESKEEDPRDSVEIRRKSRELRRSTEENTANKDVEERKSSREVRRSTEDASARRSTEEGTTTRKAGVDSYKDSPSVLSPSGVNRNMTSEDKLKEIEKQL